MTLLKSVLAVLALGLTIALLPPAAAMPGPGRDRAPLSELVLATVRGADQVYTAYTKGDCDSAGASAVGLTSGTATLAPADCSPNTTGDACGQCSVTAGVRFGTTGYTVTPPATGEMDYFQDCGLAKRGECDLLGYDVAGNPIDGCGSLDFAYQGTGQNRRMVSCSNLPYVMKQSSHTY